MKFKILGLLAIIMFATSCSNDDGSETTDTIQLFVNHFKTTSLTSFNTVFLAQEDDRIGSDLYIEILGISGFEFEPGFTYQLTVERYTVRNPETDYTTSSYSLISIDSKTEVPFETTFTIPLTRIFGSSQYYNWVRGNTDAGFSIDNEIPIDCGGLCGPLDDIGNNPPQVVRGVFRHGEEGVYVLEGLY